MAAISQDVAAGAPSSEALLNDSQQTVAPSATKKSDSSSSFFKNMQKTMLQKVEKAFVGSAPRKTPVASAAVQEAGTAVHDDQPQLPSEEEQLQWALDASMADSQHAVLSGAIAEAEKVSPVESASSSTDPSAAAIDTSLSAADQLQAAATEAARRLEAAEVRASSAEAELAAAKERVIAVVAERDALRIQLTEHECIIRGLTEQLEGVNGQRDKAADKVHEDGSSQHQQDQQRTITQMLARISELEGQLPQATHFGTPAKTEEAVAMGETVDKQSQGTLKVDDVATPAGQCAEDEVKEAVSEMEDAAAVAEMSQVAEQEKVQAHTVAEMEKEEEELKSAEVSNASEVEEEKVAEMEEESKSADVGKVSEAESKVEEEEEPTSAEVGTAQEQKQQEEGTQREEDIVPEVSKDQTAENSAAAPEEVMAVDASVPEREKEEESMAPEAVADAALKPHSLADKGVTSDAAHPDVPVEAGATANRELEVAVVSEA